MAYFFAVIFTGQAVYNDVNNNVNKIKLINKMNNFRKFLTKKRSIGCNQV